MKETTIVRVMANVLTMRHACVTATGLVLLVTCPSVQSDETVLCPALVEESVLARVYVSATRDTKDSCVNV